MQQWLDDPLRGKPLLEYQDAYLETFFTDVEYFREMFQRLATASILSRRILIIYGIGGVGKSTLLRMFRLFCRRRNIPIGLVGAEEIKSTVDVLTKLAEDLSRGGVRLPRFSSVLRHHQTIQSEVVKKSRKTEGISAKLGKVSAKTLVQTVATAIPIVGPLAGTLGSMGVESFVDWLRGFLSQEDIDLHLNPVKQLTENFLVDIAKVADQRRLVIMVDTYEQMEALDAWLKDWVRMLHLNTLVVIAGRTFPGQSWERTWPGWMAQANVEELKPMTKRDLRALTYRYYQTIQGEEPERVQVEAVVRFARGLPLVATTAARLWASYGVMEFQAVKVQVVADLVDSLLKGVPENLSRIIMGAATLRWFDRSLLRAVLQMDVSDMEYRELCHFPFVRPVMAGKLAVHDVVREILDENLKTQDPEQHREWHERAAAYFKHPIAEVGKGDRELLFLERLYHLVQAGDESLAIDESQRLVKISLGYYWRPFAESVIALLDQYLQQRHNRHWLVYLRYWVTLLDPSIEKQMKVIKALVAILEEPDLDTRLRALIPIALGDVPTEANISPNKRIQLLEEAMGSGLLSPQETTESHLYLGHVLREKGEWEKSVQALRQAVRGYQTQDNPSGETWASQWLSYTFLMIGDWDNAIEWGQKAVALSRQLDGYRLTSTLEALGWAYTYHGQLDLALDAIEESLRLAKARQDKTEVIRVSRRLAEIYDRQGRWGLSVPLYKNFIQEDEKLGRIVSKASFLSLLGISHFKQGLVRQAERLLCNSLSHIHLHFKQIVLIWLGELRLVLMRLDKSHQYFEKALSVSIGRPYYIAQCMLGLLQVDVTSSQAKDLSGRVQKIQKLSLNLGYYDHLAHLCLLQGHVAWDGRIPEWGSGFNAALSYYRWSLLYALRYNRFLLDEVLWGSGITTSRQPIISRCLEKGKEGYQMLTIIRSWWQTGVNYIDALQPNTTSSISRGILLLEAEHIVRRQEIGDGTPQKTVVDQIESAMTTAHGR